MSTIAITVTPITRLEDHGKMEILFNEKGTGKRLFSSPRDLPVTTPGIRRLRAR
jgi:hypothetical protein